MSPFIPPAKASGISGEKTLNSRNFSQGLDKIAVMVYSDDSEKCVNNVGLCRSTWVGQKHFC